MHSGRRSPKIFDVFSNAGKIGEQKLKNPAYRILNELDRLVKIGTPDLIIRDNS